MFELAEFEFEFAPFAFFSVSQSFFGLTECGAAKEQLTNKTDKSIIR
jgi:hypothetical protein